MIKDQLMNNKDQKIVFSYCNTCLLKGHNFLTCNKMHYIPDKDFLIKKYVFCNPTLQRQIFARRGNKSKNALSNKINFQKLYKILDYKEFSSLMMQNELEQFEEEDKDEKNIISILEGKDLRELTSGKTNELKENTYVSHTKQWSYSESGFKKNASKDEIVMAGLGGLLHDIGKVKIATDIINKPDKLTDEEFNVIKQHPSYGYELLVENSCDCQGVDFDIIKRIVNEHHENFNGTGYPNKLVGVDIHLLARVTAIADFFDAITTKRSYHEILSTEDAINVMANSVGKKLDPELFTVFTTSVKQLVFNGRSNLELPDSFDPCQPQNTLPFRRPQPKFKVKNISKNDEGEKSEQKFKKKVS